MYNIIGIFSDNSERILATGFASWFEAFDYAVAYGRTNVACIQLPAWYRFDREVAE